MSATWCQPNDVKPAKAAKVARCEQGQTGQKLPPQLVRNMNEKRKREMQNDSQRVMIYYFLKTTQMHNNER